MEVKLQKKGKNRFNKKQPTLNYKSIKLLVIYFINDPIALIKVFFYLLRKGPNKFFSKLHQIENKQKKYTNIANTPYHKMLVIKYYLIKMFTTPLIILKIKYVCIKILKILFSNIFNFLLPYLYFFITVIFFTLFKIFSLILFPFKKKMKVVKEKTKIDGISFIIPTWNKKDMVLDCVKNLDIVASSEYIDIPKEIIVIDNGSVDKTFEELSKLKTTTPLIPIRSNINLGFARGINLGASKVKYNYIYLMNNDMIPKPKLITEIVNFAQKLLKKNEPFFGLSSQIFFYDPTKRREESGKNYYRPDFGYLYVAHCVNHHNLQTPSITGYPGGGSSLINKDLFLKLGGYDKDLYLPLYDEDLDLGFIAWKFGFPSYFVPSSQIIHHHRSSSKKLKFDPNYYMFKNWLTFILKNYDSLSLILSHIFFYPFRMLEDQRFVNYAWENTKIMHKILYKKVMLSRYKRFYKDSELVNFPKFEFEFNNK